MKKLLALLLTLTMCFAATAALAEGLQTAEITVDALEGKEMYFESLGLTLTIPEVLAQTDVTEENAAQGVFDCYALADASAYIMLGANQMTTEDAVQQLIATLQADATYSDIGILTINGIAWLTYSNTSANMVYFTTNVGDILLTCYASPANDEGFTSVVLSTLGSLVPDAE